MKKTNHDFRRTNGLALAIAWLVLIFAVLPNVMLDKNALGDAVIIWGLGISIFLPGTIIYFFNRKSSLIRYFVSGGAILLVYGVLYVQKGMLDNLFLIPVCLVAGALYFDRLVAIVSTLIAIATGVALFLVAKNIFFPDVTESEFIVYCIALIVVGLILVIQGQYGNRLIYNERKQSAETAGLYNQLKDLLANIENNSVILDNHISGIQSDSVNVMNEARQVTARMQKFGAAIEQTAQLASQSNNALIAIKNSIQKTAANSESMISGSMIAFDMANRGKTMITDLVNQIKVTEETVNTASDIVSMLSVESRKITDIASSVNDITQKTNILALNVSIEATRAGSSGEGFIAVADEMRSFAEQTSGALGGIAQSLQDLTEKIDQVKTQITNGSLAVKTGLEKAKLTSEYFSNIINRVGAIRNGTTTVSRNIQVLAQESTEVFSNLEDITAFTEQSLATVEELSSCSVTQRDQVNKIKERLTDLVKLSDELKTLVFVELK